MIGLAAVTAVIVALATAAAPASSPDPLQPVRTQFAAARNTLINNFQAINTRSGLAPALRERLAGDTPGAGFSAKPAWMSAADFIEYMTYLAKLDMSLVDQYATGSYHALSAVRGADDTVFKSPTDGTMQPLGVYVPGTYDPHKPASLIVFLHGRT
ncbi:MAG TPA: hypothetical protein VGQ96_03395, partial [Candidatus Eremiobacteraceae bacterium]|nr:hypothetical protein [Candidatus Eremiobacteraceae bacterium]